MGAATLIETDARDAGQDAMFRSLFDRTDNYAAFAKSLREARKFLSRLSGAEVGRLLPRLRREYEALRAADDDALLAEMSGAPDSLYAFYAGSAPRDKRR